MVMIITTSVYIAKNKDGKKNGCESPLFVTLHAQLKYLLLTLYVV